MRFIFASFSGLMVDILQIELWSERDKLRMRLKCDSATFRHSVVRVEIIARAEW